MSATPSDPQSAPAPAGDAQHPAVTFGDWLHQVWKNQGTFIIAACVIAVLAVFAKGGWEYYQAQQEADIETAYAAAATPEKLQAFTAANPAHPLAGLAQLRLADEAYAAGKFADAQAGYEKSAAILKSGPFAARAQFGAVMAKLSAGKTAEAQSALKQFSADTTQLKGIRAEATYHLASLAADAGQSDEVAKLSDLLMQIDPSSPWTQRAMGLRASLPVAAAAPKPPAGPTAPSVQLTLPGK